MLFFFLLPLISLLPGTVVALQYSQFNYISFAVLYSYIVINQLIENILIRLPTNDFERSKNMIIGLELINITLLLFFALRYSWLNALALLLYTIIIQLQFLFGYYDLEKIAAIIVSFLNVIFLNSISFYLHTHFVHLKFSAYYIVLFLPYLLYELARTGKNMNKILFFVLGSLSYLFVVLILWPNTGSFSVSLILSAPFFLAYTQKNDPKYMPTYLILFTAVYIILFSWFLLS